VLTYGRDSARVWDAETGKAVGDPMPSVGSASFSPDGRRVLTYRGDSARLWDAETGKPLGPAMQPGGAVRQAYFRPDGRAVLVLGSERARLWFIPDPVELNLPRIKLWVDVLTTITMDEQGVTRSLTSDEWNRKRKELDDMGGPPVIRLPGPDRSVRRE
jgi:WD40 repeat protein